MSDASFKLIIFDLDGTLMDTHRDLAYAVNQTLKQFGYTVLSEERVRDAIGHGMMSLLSSCMPDKAASFIELEVVPVFTRYYSNHLAVHTSLYEGVIDFLNHSKGNVLLSMLTHKPRVFTEPLLKYFNLDTYFTYYLCGDDLFRKKPDPEGLVRIMSHFAVDPVQTLFVGDSPVDIRAGKAAGVTVFAAGYGFRGDEELRPLHPEKMLLSFEEIFSLLG